MSVTTPIRRYRHLIAAVLERELLIFLRYPLNALGDVVSFFAMFAVVYVGGTAIAGEAFTGSLEAVVVGFFLWMLVTLSFAEFGTSVSMEAQWGTLERHFLSPFGFGPVLLAKALAKVVRVSVMAVLTLTLVLLLTGERLQVDLLTILPVLAATLAPVFGIGFAYGGVAVLYKRIGNWVPIVQYVFIALVAAPAAPGQVWLRALPIVQGSAMLQSTMRDGVRLWEFEPTALATLAGVAVAYFAGGYWIFQRCQRRARRLGVLGDY